MTSELKIIYGNESFKTPFTFFLSFGRFVFIKSRNKNVKILKMSESKSKKTSQILSSTAKPVESIKANTSKSFQEMTYGKSQFKYMWIGIGLIALGMILMSGGWMPSPDVWDESIIYSARRTVLAPICIIAGLIMQVFAIFKI